jgi:hypothetical protein
MDFNPLCEPLQSIAARFERIVPNRTAPVEAVLDHPYLTAARVQSIFEHTRPALIER